MVEEVVAMATAAMVLTVATREVDATEGSSKGGGGNSGDSKWLQ